MIARNDGGSGHFSNLCILAITERTLFSSVLWLSIWIECSIIFKIFETVIMFNNTIYWFRCKNKWFRTVKIWKYAGSVGNNWRDNRFYSKKIWNGNRRPFEWFLNCWPALSRHLRSPLGNAFSRMDFMALSTSLPVSDSPYFENNGSDSSYMHLADPPSWYI